MVFYNAKQMVIINGKGVSTYYFLQSIPCYFLEYDPVFEFCLLEFHTYGASFLVSLMLSFMLSQYRDSHARSQVFSVPM